MLRGMYPATALDGEHKRRVDDILRGRAHVDVFAEVIIADALEFLENRHEGMTYALDFGLDARNIQILRFCLLHDFFAAAVMENVLGAKDETRIRDLTDPIRTMLGRL